MKKLFSKILIFVCMLFGAIAIINPIGGSFAEENEKILVNISSAQEFIAAFSSSSIYNDSNIELNLTQDIDFEGIDLSSIYQTKNTFAGVFDGKGYTISNISLSSTFLYYGIIPYANGATIKNLKVTGDVIYNFDTTNINEVYAGILVGYGENIIIENCELYNIKVTTQTEDEDEEDIEEPVASSQLEENVQVTTYPSIDCQIYSNINFGGLAGKLKGNPFANEANVIDCVSYYDINLVVNKNSNLNVGGLVGQLEQAYILNCLSFGDITYSSNLTVNDETIVKNQYLGGIVGYVLGTNSHIKSTCYGGDITAGEVVTALNVNSGAVVGGVSASSKPSVDNINFSYWTSDLNAVGVGLTLTSDKIGKVDIINKDLLKQKDLFDLSNPTWDFDKTWSLIESTLHLQNFQTYTYIFNQVLDVTQTIQSANFQVEGSEEMASQVSVKYGETLYINIAFKEQYCGYYSLSSILLNAINVEVKSLEDYVVKNEDGVVCGYRIPVEVSDLTDGSYSFTISANLFECLITISDEAAENNQGGVRSADASSTTNEMPISFAYNTAVKRIVAVGNGIYSFDYWELYYYDENGEATQRVDFENCYNSNLSIAFGTAPFNKEFKLIANFTSENAIKIEFPEIKEGEVKAILVDGVLFEEEPISVSPNNTRLSLEIITNKNYILDYSYLVKTLQKDFGENTITQTNDPVYDELTGETTYKFSINMRAFQGIEGNSLSLYLDIKEDKSNSNNNMIWIYIAIAVAVVIVAVVVVIIIIRKRRGGGKGKGKPSKTQKDNKKSSSYKSYYV